MKLLPAWRRCWRIPLIVIWLLWGLVLAATQQLLARLQPAHQEQSRAQLTQHWMRGLLDILPLDTRYFSAASAAPALWICNHISWLDIVVLAALYPQRFVAKAEVADWPLIGWLARAAGTLFIQRGNAGDLKQELGQLLQQGNSVIVFAEGTTTAGDRVAPMHGRLLGAAQGSQHLLQPVALGYYRQGRRDQLAPFVGAQRFEQHLWQLLGSAPLQARVTFLPPITADSGNRQQLANQAREQIAQTLGVPLLSAAGKRRDSACAKQLTSGMNARKSASNAA